MRHLSLRQKLMASFALILFIQIAMGISFTHKLSHVDAEMTDNVTEIQPALVATEQLGVNLMQMSMHMGLYMLDKESYHLTEFDEHNIKLHQNINLLEKSSVVQNNSDLRALLNSISQEVGNFILLRPGIMALVEDNGKNIIATKYASDEVNPLAMEISQLLSEMIQVEEDEDASFTRKQILSDLNNLRYAWSNMINEMRLFLAFRTANAKSNMLLYKDSVISQIKNVEAWEDELTFEQAEAIEQVVTKTGHYFNSLDQLIKLHESDKWRMDAWIAKNRIHPLTKLIEKDISSLVAGFNTISQESNNTVKSLYNNGRNETVISSLVALVILTILGWLLIRTIQSQLGSDPRELLQITKAIASGDLKSKLDIKKPTGVYASVLTMQDNLRKSLEDEHHVAAVNGRVKHALDRVTTNVMITDDNLNIVYMNEVALRNAHEFEDAIRKDVPGYKADDIIGSNICMFHKNPDAQRELLSTLEQTIEANHNFAGRSLKSAVSPVFGDDGNRIGTVIELVDRTEEAAIEIELQDIINTAQAGDLSRRIDLSNKDDFYERLSRGINEMVDVIERVIDDTVNVISAMARGNLSRQIDADYEGCFGQLKNDVNGTINKLTDVMSEIEKSADLVFSGAQEIAQGNKKLSNRTELQSASLQQTASSMKEMTTLVKNNAENAINADQLASNAQGKAEEGGKVVGQAIMAMNEITESSNKIAAIISVIDEIAFQTNLLALNAAVEAARAGEQGRGFAVVASEVRNLAGRSATAAKEIKDLIEDSVVKVGEGSKLVDASGHTLEEIMASVKEVNDIITDIASSSTQQSEGIGQVNHAINQMDEMTQQNTTMVQEATTASKSMDDQARNLNKLVGFFRLSQDDTPYSGQERRNVNRPWHNTTQTGKDSPSHALDFSSAKAKHLAWKTRIRDFVEGNISLDEHNGMSEHDCDLGKWMDHFALDKYGHLPHMQKLNKEHVHLHEVARKIVGLGNAGKMEDAKQFTRDIDITSTQIVELLHQVEEAVCNESDKENTLPEKSISAMHSGKHKR